MGNHEDMLVQHFRGGEDGFFWGQNGGYETSESYPDGKVFPEHVEWMSKLPVYLEDEFRVYVHAGISKMDGDHMSMQSRHVMIWVREPFLWQDNPHPTKLVVHGHTPCKIMDHSYAQNGRLNLDTGAVFFGKLTCAVFNDEQKLPIEFIEVKELKVNDRR